jgi:hypothetical protein
MPVKWDAIERRWRFDWNGVSEAEARKHGFIALPRAYVPRAPQFVVSPAAILAAVEAAIVPAVRRLEEARQKREQTKRKLYFAAWYSVNRGKVAARRKAQREAARQLTRSRTPFDASV